MWIKPWKTELSPYFTLYLKINSWWIKSLNVRSKTVRRKFFENYTAVKTFPICHHTEKSSNKKCTGEKKTSLKVSQTWNLQSIPQAKGLVSKYRSLSYKSIREIPTYRWKAEKRNTTNDRRRCWAAFTMREMQIKIIAHVICHLSHGQSCRSVMVSYVLVKFLWGKLASLIKIANMQSLTCNSTSNNLSFICLF